MGTLRKYSVAWFVILTVALSFATYLLPLPIEQKSLLVPILMVCIPTIVSLPLVLLTWAYVRSGHSVWAVTFLHGVQNGLVVLNRGLSIVSGSWLLVASYFILAVVLLILDRRLFFAHPSKA